MIDDTVSDARGKNLQKMGNSSLPLQESVTKQQGKDYFDHGIHIILDDDTAICLDET